MLNFGHQDKDTIEPITPDGLDALRLSWGSSFDRATLKNHLLTFTDVSWQVKKTREYLVGGFWRGRRQIGMIIETLADRNKLALIGHALDTFDSLDSDAIVLSHFETEKDRRFYSRLGWSTFDEILTFERDGCSVSHHPPSELTFRQFTVGDLDDLLKLEMASFPWLWWSDPADFIRYTKSLGVSVYTAWIEDRMVGYIGTTVSNFRGHLDRIAVRPEFQRRGYGEEMLSRALSLFENSNVKRVSLNTQVTNHKSQGLYRKYGFRPVGEPNTILGIWLSKPGDSETETLLA